MREKRRTWFIIITAIKIKYVFSAGLFVQHSRITVTSVIIDEYIRFEYITCTRAMHSYSNRDDAQNYSGMDFHNAVFTVWVEVYAVRITIRVICLINSNTILEYFGRQKSTSRKLVTVDVVHFRYLNFKIIINLRNRSKIIMV